MEIITNLDLSRKFKQIQEYKMDLGLAIKIDDSTKKNDYASGGLWKIKDKTIKKYYDNYGKYLNRIGKIGTLLFYTDNEIKNGEILIINDNKIYLSKYDNSEIRMFLSNLINNIINDKIEPYSKIIEEKENFVDLKNMSNEELADYLRKNR